MQKPADGTRRDFVVAASLANLLCLAIYANVLDPANAYFLDRPTTAAEYLGSLAVVVVLAAIGIALAAAWRRTSGWRARLIELLFFLGVALAIHGLRAQLDDLFEEQRAKNIAGILVEAARNLALLAAILPVARRRPIRRAMATVLLVLSPAAVLFPANVLRKAAGAGADAALFVEKPPAPIQPSRSGNRVIVLLLDELDQFLAFDDRPSDLKLPVLDGLAGSSFHGTRAIAPALETAEAIPSLLTGRTVLHSRPAGPSNHRLELAGGGSVLFSDASNFLDATTKSGRNVAVVGWYHPYCRVIGDDVADCVSRAYLAPVAPGFGNAFVRQTGALVASWPFGRDLLERAGVEKLPIRQRRFHGESWKRIHERARRAIEDARFDLVFVHYPLPHPPGIWDPEERTLLVEEPGSYLGNLALMDESLGELLAAANAGSRGQTTSVVVLADHGKRVPGLSQWLPSERLPEGGPRPVPFVVRVPGGTGVADDTPFAAIALHDLVPELLEGRLTTSEAVRDWLIAWKPRADAL